MRAIIVDDKLSDIQLIEILVKQVAPEIQIVGRAETLLVAEQLIQTLKPDLVFLDINFEVEGVTSFYLLRQLAPIDFEIIFITAHGKAEYQTQALQFSGLDFILKPLDIPRLAVAIQKAKERKAQHDYPQQIEILLRRINGDTQPISISIREGKEVREQVANIVYCKANENMSWIHLHHVKKPLSSNKAIGFYEKLLTEYPSFCRVHHGTLLNLDYVKEVDNRNSELILKTGERICVSKRKWQTVKEHLQNQATLHTSASVHPLKVLLDKILKR